MEKYESEHLDFVKKTASECALFLKRDDSFPLKAAGTIAAFGAGVRGTIKGGTGSGEVNSRFSVNVYQGLKDAGLDCFTPYGAFYAFPCIKSTGMTSEEFCEKLLLEKHVAIVPGNAFGKCGEGFVRISYAASLEDIKEAMKLVKEFVEEHKG